MELLSFDICGKFAHFRKFYSNSSALTHFIPPRTTINGIIAGILGIEKDSYYEAFSLEDCNIGVRLLGKVKKTIQKLKYLKIVHPNDLNGSYLDPNQKVHIANTMVPFEFLSPINLMLKNNFVSYRIYYQCKTERNRKFFERLKEQLDNKKECYFPVSMGTANFTAFISRYKLHTNPVKKNNREKVSIDSVIPLNYLNEFPQNSAYHIVQETLPMDFNKDRYLKAHSEIIFDLNCNPLNVNLSSEFLSLHNNGKSENIVFLA